MKHRHTDSTTHANGAANGSAEKPKPREYTTENLAVVKRVRGCKVTEYYEILAVKRDCEENDVKKAYRKVGGISVVYGITEFCPARLAITSR
jgi:DnaJ homolog subfamily B member 12